jgi:hypothetical protein
LRFGGSCLKLCWGALRSLEEFLKLFAGVGVYLDYLIGSEIFLDLSYYTLIFFLSISGYFTWVIILLGVSVVTTLDCILRSFGGGVVSVDLGMVLGIDSEFINGSCMI